MKIHHYIHEGTDSNSRKGIYSRLDRIEKLLEKIMASLDEVLADVTAETTALDGIAALIAGLKQQIKDALSGATLPPAVQSKVDAVFAAAEVNKGKIAAALEANVP